MVAQSHKSRKRRCCQIFEHTWALCSKLCSNHYNGLHVTAVRVRPALSSSQLQATMRDANTADNNVFLTMSFVHALKRKPVSVLPRCWVPLAVIKQTK